MGRSAASLRQLLPYAKGIPPLGATAQLLEPEVPDASHERLEERMAGGNCIVLQPPPEHALQPSGYSSGSSWRRRRSTSPIR